MKKITSILAGLAFVGVISAQEAEMKATQAAFKANNLELAITEGRKAMDLINNNRSVKPDDLADFYAAYAQAAFRTNRHDLAGTVIERLNHLETQDYWVATNRDTRQDEFFFNKTAAETITNTGNYSRLKQQKPKSKHMPELRGIIATAAQDALSQANTSYEAQNFTQAGDKFVETYHLAKAIDSPSDLYYYYGGVAYMSAKDYKKATEIFNHLIDEEFTGVRTIYVAKDAQGNDVTFSNKEDMDAQIRLNLYKDGRTQQTESVEQDLYQNALYVMLNDENYENAVKYAEAASRKYPDNENIQQMVSAVYLRSGQTSEFEKSLKSRIDNNTASSQDYFNYAKTLDDREADSQEVMRYYQRSLELDANNKNALMNTGFHIMKPEKDLVAEMNANLGNTAKEKRIYEENKKKRADLYKAALPYFERAFEQDKSDMQVATILRTAYESLEMDDKYFEMRKHIEENR
ncbi:MAG: hypothetical protein Q4F57_01280 [Weeksellaceae bacterium]|nr:hypothetical protein [Weeksellaceae bacterium]